MLFHHSKIWQLAMRLGGAPCPHSHTPLWDIPQLPELASILDHGLWIDKGVIYLSQVVAHGSDKPFQTLKDNFALPNHMFLRYLQLRYSLNTQFNDSIPALKVPLLVDIVSGMDPKKLISQIYTYLLQPTVTTTARQLKSRWKPDLGAVSDEDWEEALANCKTVSPKLSDHLTHLYILHRSYPTPYRISKYRHGHRVTTAGAVRANASFYHLLWTCTSIQGFWTQGV